MTRAEYAYQERVAIMLESNPGWTVAQAEAAARRDMEALCESR